MQKISGKVWAYCGYHKCMTMYSRRTFRRACRLDWRMPRGIRHLGHDLNAFYDTAAGCRIASVSGHAIDLDRFEDIRVVRFIRDPRDLLVSGYHYHKRGAEPWCHTVGPQPGAWDVVRGTIPDDFPSDHSMMSFLNHVSRDDGMRAELTFRAKHFASMREWPDDDPRVRVFRYEDIIGNEDAAFHEILDFMGFRGPAKRWGMSYALRHAAGRKRARTDHIRNARSGQGADVLPADVVSALTRDYGDVLERYGYV